MTTTGTPLMKQLDDLLREANVTVKIGLRQQGHFETVQRMILACASWEDIGKVIGWSGDAVARSWAMESAHELAALTQTVQAQGAERCIVTGNLLGTDTWMANASCPCANCQRMLRREAEADLSALRQQIAETVALCEQLQTGSNAELEIFAYEIHVRLQPLAGSATPQEDSEAAERKHASDEAYRSGDR